MISIDPPEPPSRQGSLPWTRRLGAGALGLSLLVHGIFVILAIFFFFKWINPPPALPPDFASASGGGGGNQGQTANKVQTQMRRAVSSDTNRRIATSSEASFTLPDNPEDLMDSGLPNLASTASSSGSGGGGGGGSGGGLGSGIGPGTGPGSGGAGHGLRINMTPFGSKDQTGSALEGHLYDFKQNEKGVPVQYDIPGIEDFAKRVTDIQRRGFQDSAFSHFFKAPDALYISELAIPPTPADAGPSFFGAADKVKPSGWLAHYSGFIQAPRDIHFRFVGSADDYISVFSKGRPRLIACHSEAQAAIQEKWEPSRTDKDYTGPMGTLIHGDWIRLKKGEIMPIDLSIGERPGGVVGFLLLVEEKDKDYRKAADGRPITPIFTLKPVTPELRERVTNDFKDWAFDWDDVPVFTGVAKSANDPFK